jgi:hypothetical protein
MSEQINLTPEERTEIRKRVNEWFGTTPEVEKEWDEFLKTPRIVFSVKLVIGSARAGDGQPKEPGQA